MGRSLSRLIGALGAAWLARLAVSVALPATSLSCACPPSGSAVVLDAATIERKPKVEVGGPACNAASVVCQQRDANDRCDTYWIEPIAEGRCLFSVTLSDGKRIEAAIDYKHDGDYPCRGDLRPLRDGPTRISAGAGT